MDIIEWKVLRDTTATFIFSKICYYYFSIASLLPAMTLDSSSIVTAGKKTFHHTIDIDKSNNKSDQQNFFLINYFSSQINNL